MAPSGLPSYDELPVTPEAPPGSSWGLWGEIGTDKLGCLNLLTPERIVRAASHIKRGKVFGLSLEASLPSPPLFGRPAFTHRVSGDSGGLSHDDVLHSYNTSSSSQWDGFRHVSHLAHGFYGGVPDDDHGIHHWFDRIVGRCVLVDIGRWREAQGRPLVYDTPDPISAEDVLNCLHDQGTRVEDGDILLLRTGWLSWYKALDEAGRQTVANPKGFATPGLVSSDETVRMLWNLHIAAIAADNPGVEVFPPGAPYLQAKSREDHFRWPGPFMHPALLPLLGMPLGELWDLDALAEDCADTGTHGSFFTSAPLHLRNGVNSPPNALAIR